MKKCKTPKKYQFAGSVSDLPTSRYKKLGNQWYELQNGQYVPVDVNPDAESNIYSTNGKNVKFKEYSTEGITQGANLDDDGIWRKKVETTTNNILGYNDFFKSLNTVMDLTQFFSGTINDKKNSKEEQDKLYEARYRTNEYGYNPYEKGLNNVPAYFQNGGKLSAKKARKILHDGTVHGKPITEQQRKYFGAVANGYIKQDGGFINNSGYLDNSETSNNPYNIIPSNLLTMDGVSHDVMAFPDKGKPVLMKANSGKYSFKGATRVLEIPLKQNGGVTEINSTSNNPNAELEEGEVFQKQNGEIVKAAEGSGTHEEGGSLQRDVYRVLEDTGDKRDDKESKLLKLSPSEAEELTGFKPKYSVTHSKLYELSNEFYGKKLRKFEKEVDKNLQYSKKNGGIYSDNSLNENMKNMQQFPTPIQLFDLIFNHQENIKQKYNIDEGEENKYGGKLQNGGSVDYIKKRAKQVSSQPSGSTKVAEDMNNTYYKTPGSNDFISVPKTGKYAKQDPNTYIPSLVDYSWEDIVSNKLAKDTPEYKAIYDKARSEKYPNSDEYSFVPKQNKINITYNEPIIQEDNTQQNTYSQKYAKPSSVGSSEFNEPLQWYDVAGNFLNYLSSLDRYPVDLEQMQKQPLRVHEVNPLPTLLQNQGDFNAIKEELPQSGVGYANLANLMGNKYKVNNEVLGQYENINKGKYDAVDQYNDQSNFEIDKLNMGLRDQFVNRVLQGKEIQRQSKLNALDDYFTKLAQNRKLNREGNLVLQLTPYFDQYGQFNGKQYKMIINGANTNIIDKTTGKVVKTVKTSEVDSKTGNLKTKVTQTTTP